MKNHPQLPIWPIVALVMLTSTTVGALQGVPGVDFAADRFIISVNRGVDLFPVDFTKGLAVSTGYPSLDQLCALQDVARIEELYPRPVKNEILREIVKRMFVVYLGPSGNLGSAIAAFGESKLLEFAEPYYYHHLYYTPNDPMIGSWYHLSRIETYTAWDFIRGDSTSGPVLGVVDDGVYYDHPDLEPNMWINGPEDIDGDGVFTDADLNGIDDDDNGYIDDVVGWDFGNNDNFPFESTPWHGTHVAGCASMATDNGYGGAAVSWAARIMAIKAARDSDPNSIPFGYSGIIYATDNGATVINLSWGRHGSPSQGEQNIITAAYQAGVVVVAAAGNENTSSQSYPAAYNHVVAVASTNSTDHRSSFSNYGSWVDICAPGEGIFSTWDHNSFTALDGTSMASPITAGSICLVRAANPSFTVDQAVQRLLDNADTIDYLNPGFGGLLGAGRVNIAAAIGRDMFPRFNLDRITVTQTEDDGDGLLNPAERFNLVVYISNSWADADSVTGVIRSDGQFTALDSTAYFGDIPGNGGSGDNASAPFDIRVNPDALVGQHEFTLHLTTSVNFQSDLTLSISITLEQAGFPGNIPGNIESHPLVFDFDSDSQKEILIGASDRNYYAFEADGSISPGWPQAVSHEALGGAAVGDLDHDGDFEVVGMSRNANVYAWNANGTILPGFPRNCGSLMLGTPVLGDIDGNQDLEIVVGSFVNRSVYVLNHDGSDYPNWPFQGGGNFYGSAALADIDNDGLPEIIFAGFDSLLHVWNSDKTYVPGFPARVSGQVKNSPCVADIDGDDNLNIIVGATSGDLYVFDNVGAVMPNFPVHAGNAIVSSPSLADIDRDGHLEIIFGCNDWRLYVYNSNGQPQNGFPYSSGGIINASPAVGDIDGDGWPDIAFGAYDGYIYALNHLGQLLPNFPIPVTSNGQITGSCALADLDGDGDCEIITGVKTSGNNLEVIDYKAHLPSEIFPWPSFGNDIHRSGYYGYFETGVGDDSPVPLAFTLEQNYPNPFNGSTVIRFALPQGGDVNLAIYDLLGRRVRSLYNGILSSGAHEIVWDGLGEHGIPVASGIYFYRLESSHGRSMKRMTLLK